MAVALRGDPLDQSHFAEGAVGADDLQYRAGRHDGDLARPHDVHSGALVLLGENALLRLEALQRIAAADQSLEVESVVGHIMRLTLHRKRVGRVRAADNRVRFCRVMEWRRRYARRAATRNFAANGRTNARFSYIGLYKVGD